MDKTEAKKSLLCLMLAGVGTEPMHHGEFWDKVKAADQDIFTCSLLDEGYIMRVYYEDDSAVCYNLTDKALELLK